MSDEAIGFGLIHGRLEADMLLKSSVCPEDTRDLAKTIITAIHTSNFGFELQREGREKSAKLLLASIALLPAAAALLCGGGEDPIERGRRGDFRSRLLIETKEKAPCQSVWA